jgi:uncharacterized membrane protein
VEAPVDTRVKSEVNQLRTAIAFALGIVGAVLGTVVGLIVLTIIVGLADGH